MKYISIALILFIVMPALASYAEDAVPAFDKGAFIAAMETKKILKIGMIDCVVMALKNNSEIQIKKISPLMEDANVMIQRAAFESDLTFEYNMADDTDLSDNPLFGPNPTKVRTNTFDLGWDQKLITGAQVSLDFTNTRTSSNYARQYQAINPMYDSDAYVTVTQPLLKGFGITVNKADLLIAKNNKLKSTHEFKLEVMKMLTDVKKAYYDFQYSQEQYKTAFVSLKRVEDLYAINKEKYAKGLASNVDLLQSESEVARFEQAVASSEGDMKLAEDNLKFITNLVNDEELWNADILLLDKIAYEKQAVDVIDAVDKAFSHRPDYEAARIDLKSKDISVIYYKNGMLPIVDLTGSYGVNGLADDYGKDLSHLGGAKYQDWSIGVSVKVPLGSQEEKGNYEKSKLEKKRALITFKRLEQKMILEVRNAARDVDIRYRMLEASLTNKEAEEKNYEAQEARFKAGLVSTHDIIDYQEKLARAEVNYVNSVVEYNKTLVELAKAEGMTLVYDNITLE